jgi:taurine--2-oxoglutarate transaminase
LASVSFQAIFGYTPKLVTDNLHTQFDQISIASPKAIIDLKEKASQLLLDFLKASHGKIFYTVSGAESIENAIKMARLVSGKKVVLARRESYHGASLGALGVTGDWRKDDHLCLDQWTHRIPDPKSDPSGSALVNFIENELPTNDIAAICLETIVGANGVHANSNDWWQSVNQVCKKHNIAIIIDEVTTGFGRTGENFAFHHYPVEPDFVCMAKGITAGVIPLGAVWVSKSYASYFDNNVLSCGLTNYAHPLGLKSMCKVLNYLQSSDFKNSYNKNEAVFKSKLKEIQSLASVQETRSYGLIAAIDLNKEITSAELLKQGILAIARDSRIIIAPQLNTNSAILTEGLDHLVKVLKDTL